jgi:hypothetical protein
MLKLNYTDVGLYMERTRSNPKLLIAQRVLFAFGDAVRAIGFAVSKRIAPYRTRSVLLSVTCNLPELEALAIALQQECNSSATVFPVDNGFVEVTLSGSWIAESKEAHEGMFLTMMSNSLSPFGAATPTETLRERTEFLIHKLWQMSEVHISSLA